MKTILVLSGNQLRIWSVFRFTLAGYPRAFTMYPKIENLVNTARLYFDMCTDSPA
ncbi:MAG: hypothetical protein V2I41_15105 [Pseudomonadales bacterium]|nr:hypothetical protein [Pseudomonadales bacterium]